MFLFISVKKNIFSVSIFIISLVLVNLGSDPAQTHQVFAVAQPVHQQPDRVLVLAQPHGVERVQDGAGAALQPELRPQRRLQEVVPPDVPGEKRDGERHHSAALQQRDGLILRQLAAKQETDRKQALRTRTANWTGSGRAAGLTGCSGTVC